jgi:DNA-binding transcriptional LysR family regulator
VRWHISTGNMSVTDGTACAGLGIALVPGFMAVAHIADGRLVRILPDNPMDQLEVPALQARAVTPPIAGKALLKDLL